MSDRLANLVHPAKSDQLDTKDNLVNPDLKEREVSLFVSLSVSLLDDTPFDTKNNCLRRPRTTGTLAEGRTRRRRTHRPAWNTGANWPTRTQGRTRRSGTSWNRCNWTAWSRRPTRSQRPARTDWTER